MPLDALKIEVVQDWFARAADNLRVAEWCMSIKPPIKDIALFHCQQAVEKAEKGFLIWHDVRVRKTHDLNSLGVLCSNIRPEHETVLRQAAVLTDFAVMGRYAEVEMPTPAIESQEAYRLAETVYMNLLQALPQDVHPPTPTD